MSMMDTQGQGRNRELVLTPSTYAYVLDSTKGKVSVYVGPHKTTLADTDQLLVWNDTTNTFDRVDRLELAIQTFMRAGEGQYIVLNDPTSGGDAPPIGVPTEAVSLNVGSSVIIPGPTSFALWPGQSAETVDGHHLRHNQYLMVRVVNPDQAAAHWDSAVMAPQVAQTEIVAATIEGSQEPDSQGQSGDESGDTPPATSEAAQPPAVSTPSFPDQSSRPAFTMGQLLVIRGTIVSFYIPSTGVEVVREDRGHYVREAATLEQLEYCILLDESGVKRYVHGPAVVFPEPTETFVTNTDRERKFRAIELDDRTGIYVKVIAPYSDDEGDHQVGDELFIHGSAKGIYFPRPEHSIIEYDGKRKHHAIAIPVGEGRYVLNRDQGRVDTVRGPRMYLPDPRTEVVVRRVLDARTVALLYPGNEEALRVNARYETEAAQLDPGEYLGGAERASFRGMAPASALAEEDFGGEREQRRSVHTPPRTIVLDNKYEGAVGINVWPGYAVMVTDKSGDRRVELGPKAILLEYDESLMPMELSTGKPKTTDRLLRTAYLRTTNNKISDIVEVETKDLVKVRIKISMLANFEAETDQERERWFDVENYVKVLCDRVRSMLRGKAKRHGIQEFYRDSVDIVRDTILGVPEEADGTTARAGLQFKDFGLHVFDVEVLAVEIDDHDVSYLLTQAQSRALQGAIQLSEAEDESERLAAREALNRANLGYTHETAVAKAQIAGEELRLQLAANLATIAADLERAQAQVAVDELRLAEERKATEQRNELQRATDEVAIAMAKAETEDYVNRLNALGEQIGISLQQFGDKAFVEKLVESFGPLAATLGVTNADLMAKVFEGTGFQGVMETLGQRPLARAGSNGSSDDHGYRD